MVSPSASEAIRTDAAWTPWPGWSLLEVSGNHRERFLHSQVTSDVRSLAVGSSQLSALLDANGRLTAFFLLWKGADRLRVVVPDDAAAQLVSSLEGRIIADDVRIERREVPPMWLALGPAAVVLATQQERDVSMPVSLLGDHGVLGWGPPPTHLLRLDDADVNALHVVTGTPRWGCEVDAGVLVNETTLVDSAVSFHKGCFLGQETVAKVATHRGAAFAATAMEITADVEPSALDGRTFAAGGRAKAGSVLTAARCGRAVLLHARLHRDLRVDGREVVCRFDDGSELSATVRALPLRRPRSAKEMADDCYQVAVERFTEDREEAAMTLLRRAVAVCPRHADACEVLGVILGRRGRFEEAIELMQRLLEVDPTSVLAHTNMSVYFNQLGRIDDAEREAQNAAVKSMQRSRDAEEQRRVVARQRQDLEQERARRQEMFAQVLALDGADPLANFGMGELLVEAGRHADAIVHLERALAADPRYSAALLALGRAQEGLGDVEAARATYGRGIEVAAAKGDVMTANKMQERVVGLASEAG